VWQKYKLITPYFKTNSIYKKNPGHACPVDWKYGDQILYSHPLKSKVYFKTLYFNKEE
jgi:alkyl hydroperoxide reductase subunit AhpC